MKRLCTIGTPPVGVTRTVLAPPLSTTLPALIVRPLVATAPVKYCGALSESVPSSALTMPLVVLMMDALRLRIVVPPTTWMSMVVPPPLVIAPVVIPVFPLTARMPAEPMVRVSRSPPPKLPPVVPSPLTRPPPLRRVRLPTGVLVMIPAVAATLVLSARLKALVAETATLATSVAVVVAYSVVGLRRRRPFVPLNTKPVTPLTVSVAMMSGRMPIKLLPATPAPWVPGAT